MHELSVSTVIVDTAVRHAGGRPVARVTARIGHLRAVVPEVLHFYWGLVTRETPCERARLQLYVVPGEDIEVESVELEAPPGDDGVARAARR